MRVCDMVMRKLFLLLFVLFVTVACEDDPGFVGVSVKPDGDDVLVTPDSCSLFSGTYDPQGTATSDDDVFSMLGVYSDPVLGKTTASFMTQFSLSDSVDYGVDAIADSAKLLMYYDSWYGSDLDINELSVYRLDGPETLDDHVEYNSKMSPSLYTSKSEKLGSLVYTARDLRTSDSLLSLPFYSQYLSVPLQKSLAEEFVSAPSSVYNSNEAFKSFFKGVYVAPTLGQRTILNIGFRRYDSERMTNVLLIYYSNEDIYRSEDTITFRVSSVDTIEYDTVRYNLEYLTQEKIKFDIEMLKAQDSWSMEFINGAKGSRYSGSNAFEDITAREIKETANFVSESDLNSTNTSVGDILLVQTRNERWAKMEVLSVGKDSLRVRRFMYNGVQIMGFTSSKGNAMVNLVEHDLSPVQIDTTGDYLDQDIYVKGMGGLYGKLQFPKGEEILEGNLKYADGLHVVSKGVVDLKVSEKSEPIDSLLPRYLLLETVDGEQIPGMLSTYAMGFYSDSLNAYRFNIPAYIQHLVNNPTQETKPFKLRVAWGYYDYKKGKEVYRLRDINEPRGVILEAPKNKLQVVFSEF